MKKINRLLSLLLTVVLLVTCVTACGGDQPEPDTDPSNVSTTTSTEADNADPTGEDTSTDTTGEEDPTDTTGDGDSTDTTADEPDDTQATSGEVTTEKPDGTKATVTKSTTKAKKTTKTNLTVNLKPTKSKVSTTRTKGTTKKNTNTKIPTSLDGQTIVVSTWSTATIPAKDGTDSGNANYYASEWAKKAYNVDVEWKVVPEETYFAEFTTAALSGDTYSDICLTHSLTYLSWINDGLIIPLEDYMEDKSEKYWNKDTYTLNGHLYAMTRAASYNVSVPENYFLYNPKMIKKLGLEDPQQLALEGKWTWDKFREYCKAATDPSTGTYGVTIFNLNCLMYTNNIEEIVVEKGKYVNGYTHGKSASNMLELLTLLQEMKTKDNSIMGDVMGGLEPMNEALNAFLDGKALFTFAQSTAWLKKQKYKDYAPVTLPIGPSNGRTNYDNVLGGFSCWSIPANARYDYQDLVDFFCDTCCTWDKSRGDAYYEGDMEDDIDAYYIKNWAKRSDAEFMYEMGKNRKTRIGWNVFVNNGGIEVYQIFQPVLQNSSTPKNVLDATDGEIQTKINEVFN